MDESTTTNTIKTASDGTVKIAIEKYNDLLARAAAKPPVINRTVINKTAEMVAQDHKVWGWTFVGTGVALAGIGALRVKLGRIQA